MPLASLIPWSLPDLSTAIPQPPVSAVSTIGPNLNVGVPVLAAPPPARPRIGRPDRGNRAKVKAARRARRANR